MSSRSRTVLALLSVPLAGTLALGTAGVAEAHTAGHQSASRTPQTAPTITIHSFTFTVPATVLHGVSVRVVNSDSVAHTVTSNAAGKFNVSIPAHSTRFFKAPTTKGTYGFHCSIHPSMHGTLHVH